MYLLAGEGEVLTLGCLALRSEYRLCGQSAPKRLARIHRKNLRLLALGGVPSQVEKASSGGRRTNMQVRLLHTSLELMSSGGSC